MPLHSISVPEIKSCLVLAIEILFSEFITWLHKLGIHPCTTTTANFGISFKSTAHLSVDKSVMACDFCESTPIVEDGKASFVIVLLQSLYSQTTRVPHLQPAIIHLVEFKKSTLNVDRPACLQPLKVVWLSFSSFAGPDAKYSYNRAIRG